MHAADVLSLFDSESSIPAFEVMSNHPSYYVRWRAIQGLAYISTDLGMKKLKEALHDKHPHVRQAAEKALANFAAR